MHSKLHWKIGEKRSFFVQLLLSNMAIATVCALSMFLLSMFHSLKIEQEQLQSDFIASAKTFDQDFGRTASSLYSIVSNLVFYQNIQPFSYSNGSGKAIELIRTLGGLQASNPFLSDIYVHFYGDDYAYSGRSSMRAESLSDDLGINISDGGDLQKMLSEYMSPIYRVDQKRLLVFYPMLYSYENRGTIVFTISNATFLQLLDNSANSRTVTLLFSGETQLFLDEHSKSVLLKLQGQPGLQFQEKLQKEEYFFWSGQNIRVFGEPISPELYFVRVSDAQGALALVLENPWAYLILGVGSACAVLVFTLYITRKSYQPVRALQSTLTSSPTLESENVSGTFQEFQLFLTKYTELQGKNKELEKGLQRKFALEQNHLLHSIINGSTSQYEDFRSQALDLNIDMSAAYHLLASVNGAESVFLDSIRPLLEYRYRYAYPLSGTPGETLYIIGCDETPEPETLAQINNSAHIKISATEENITALNNQYLSLKIAQSMSVDTFQSIHGLASELLDHYEGDISSISEALDNNNEESFSALAQTFLLDLRAGHFSEATSKYLCFRLFYLYKNYETGHLSGAKNHVVIPEALLSEQAHTAFSIQSLAEAFEKQTAVISDLMVMQNDDKIRLSIDNILAYIGEKYVEPDFSLQRVAGAFQVSPSYLSTFFKENHGMKMLDYCTLLRFEKARELLHTDLTLLEISQQTGYYNTSSFIRRFKQVCGITPGEYKRQNNPGEKI